MYSIKRLFAKGKAQCVIFIFVHMRIDDFLFIADKHIGTHSFHKPLVYLVGLVMVEMCLWALLIL